MTRHKRDSAGGRRPTTAVVALAATIGVTGLCLALVVALTVNAASGPPDDGGGHDASPQHGDHMVPAAAMIAAAVALPRAGWTATASDQETTGANNVASNVLDGDIATIWHSKWRAPVAPLPHSITIDMQRAELVSELTYLPRPGASPNGRIGQFQVAVSTDGTTWAAPVATGTWADDAALKTVTFAAVTARYVRVTALTEAGNRGPWSSAAEINVLRPDDPPAEVLLPRTGWTAAASDEETVRATNPAANVLDGNAATFWHSKWQAPATPLPHTITLDMKQSYSISALIYQPRAAPPANGRIGQYEISVSMDGLTWGQPVGRGTWADTVETKTATFLAVSARYVRLTGITEAGGRGPWSSAAEINIRGSVAAGVDRSQTGSWGSTITFPLVPAAGAILPGNKMLVWSAYKSFGFGGSNGYTQTAILDLTTGAVSARTITNTRHDMFCPGIAMLADGRIMVAGGSDAARTSIYDPATDTWSAGAEMNVARGYQANTLLSNGDVFTLGGSWSGGTGGKVGEVWSATSGTWRRLPGVPADPTYTKDPGGVFRSDNHGWFIAASGGRVFHAGPSTQMHWITTAGAGSITAAGDRGDAPDMMNGNAVVYDVNKVLTLGGSPGYQDSDATGRAYTIDIGPATPVTTRVGDLAYPRAFHNSVVLPDGQVMAIGGQPYPVPFTDTDAALTPELWNPTTGTWRPLAPMAVPRTYHSIAVLLPDARVMSAGGGLCDGCATNHPDGQIFTPGYLLNPDGTPRPRPAITAAPTTAAAGSQVTVTTDVPVSSFSLIRTSEATHSINNDQRRIPLTVTSTVGNQYTLTLPSDPGVLLPGDWMLFAMDATGTPSISSTVRVPVVATTANAALARPATQSSVAFSGAAGRAVDGNTDGVYANGSVSHTNSQAQPWWQVDLGTAKPVTSVQLFNRTDCCTQRLADGTVFASATDMTGRTLAQLTADPAVTKMTFGTLTGPSVTVTPTVDTTARYVRVQLQGTGYLSLADVVVNSPVAP